MNTKMYAILVVVVMALTATAVCAERTEPKPATAPAATQNGYTVDYKIVQLERGGPKLEVTANGPADNLSFVLRSTEGLGSDHDAVEKDDMTKSGIAKAILRMSQKGVPVEGTKWILTIVSVVPSRKGRTPHRPPRIIWQKQFTVTPEMVAAATTVAQAQ